MSPWQPFPAACTLLPVVWTTDWPGSTHFKIVIQMSKYIQWYVVQRNTSTSRSKMAKKNTYFLSSTAGVAWAIFSSKSGACMQGETTFHGFTREKLLRLLGMAPSRTMPDPTTFPISPNTKGQSQCDLFAQKTLKVATWIQLHSHSSGPAHPNTTVTISQLEKVLNRPAIHSPVALNLPHFSINAWLDLGKVYPKPSKRGETTTLQILQRMSVESKVKGWCLSVAGFEVVTCC